MSFYNLYGKKKEKEQEKIITWKVLNSTAQVAELAEKSQEKLIVIFKHSTRCATSRMALRAFESGFDFPEEKVEIYFLDLLSFRAVSDEVANRFQVWHESPQIILLKNKKTVHHSSHHQISAAIIDKFI